MRRPWPAAGALALLAALPAQKQPAVRSSAEQAKSPVLADECIELHCAGDRERMREIARRGHEASDPFLVADALLRLYRLYYGTAAGDDALAAARQFSALAVAARADVPGLPDLVAAWAAQDAAGLAARQEFRVAAYKVKERLRQNQ